jgi:hypothetical protein
VIALRNTVGPRSFALFAKEAKVTLRNAAGRVPSHGESAHPLKEKRRRRMRKVAMLVGMAALISVLFASVAPAVDKPCTKRPCYGTDGNNRLFERTGDGVSDTISGRAGRDVVRADAYTQDADLLYGNHGNDRLNANDNGASDTTPEDTLDLVHGGRGFDICIVDSRAEVGGGCEDVRVDPGEA